MLSLTPVAQNFIVHWGKMGARWGINRTVAQIYALLYVSPRPVNAEEISKTLLVARSTVSTGLRELESWGVVKVVHVLGDRRDHFEAMGDVWETLRVVVQERKCRELDPALEALREIVGELEHGNENEFYTGKKLLEMIDVFETMAALYDQVQGLPTDTLVRIVKRGDVVCKLLGLSSRS